jgi:two-component system, NarL family, response regulator DesR
MSLAESQNIGLSMRRTKGSKPGGQLPRHARTAVVTGDIDVTARVSSLLGDAGWLVLPTSKPSGADIAVLVAELSSASDAEAVAVRARELGARARILVLSAATPDLVRQLLCSGIDGVVLEDDLDLQLVSALAAVQAGLVVSPAALRGLADRPALTAREKQALGMVVLGFSNADIARKLFVTESTVKSHLSSAFTKLGVRTRSEATALILDSSRGIGTGILAIVGDSEGETIAAPDWEAAPR